MELQISVELERVYGGAGVLASSSVNVNVTSLCSSRFQFMPGLSPGESKVFLFVLLHISSPSYLDFLTSEYFCAVKQILFMLALTRSY